MQAGKLRHRISLQTGTPAQNSVGEPEVSWSTTATVWARVGPLQGRERYQADQVKAELTHAIEIRYRAGVTPKMRVLFGSRIFEIESVVNPDERNEMLRLMCIEKVAV